MNHKIIVIGGAGFLGKKLLTALAANKKIDALSCLDIHDPEISNVSYITSDILSEDDLISVFNNHTIVINCAGQVTQPINTCYRINTEGINKIVKTVKHQGDIKLFHFSTVTVFGSGMYMEEGSPLNPETVYAACKAFAENSITSILPADKYCILRLSNLYGKDQSKGLLAYIRKSYLSDKKLEFNNNGDLVRYFLNVDDCVENAVDILLKDTNVLTGIYNLIGPEKYNIKELIKLCEGLLNCTFSVSYQNNKPWDNIDEISSKKISAATKIIYNHSIADIVQEWVNM
jgi:UDP-glucose 4-epimerase